MCGIFGICSINSDSRVLEKRYYLRDMFIINTIRGFDSTGFTAITPFSEIDTFKRALPGYEFIYLDRVQRLLNNLNKYKFIFAHNRSATKGTVSDNNAHPFSIEHISLVHNGTLNNIFNLDGNSQVDSERIALTMAKRGEKETIEMLDGSFTLVWYNSLTKNLCLARNDKRPLWMATDKEKKLLLFASENWMAFDVAERSGIELKALTELPSLRIIRIPLDIKDSFDKLEEESFVEYDHLKSLKSGNRSYYHDTIPKLPPAIPLKNQVENDAFKDNDQVLFTVDHIFPYKTKYNKEQNLCSIQGSPLDMDLSHMDVKAYNVDRTLFKEIYPVTANVIFTGKCKSSYATKHKVEVIVSEVEVAEPDDILSYLDEHKAEFSTNLFFKHTEKSYVSLQDFCNQIKSGCVFCKTTIYPHEHLDISWSDIGPICPACSKSQGDLYQ